MKEIILTILPSDLPALGIVRCLNHLKIGADGHLLWLRGIDPVLPLDARLKQLPVQHTYAIDANNYLFAEGSITPINVLPVLEWHSLPDFIPVELPVSKMPVTNFETVEVKLIPSHHTKEGSALLTDLATWKNYGEQAPAARLNLLQFAVSQNDEVLVIGHPLPPLPGKEYWKIDDMFLPAGYDFEIPMTAKLLTKKFHHAPGTFKLFDETGNFQPIDKSFFVPAKRSAIRLTKSLKDE